MVVLALIFPGEEHLSVQVDNDEWWIGRLFHCFTSRLLLQLPRILFSFALGACFALFCCSCFVCSRIRFIFPSPPFFCPEFVAAANLLFVFVFVNCKLWPVHATLLVTFV